MKQITYLLVFMVFIFCARMFAASFEASKTDYQKLDVPVKKFLAFPKEGSKAVYDFPINVRITGRTEDKKWYRIRVSYNFFGYFESEGWVRVE